MMATMNEKLLSEIERYMADAGIGPHRFGILAASNGRLVDRLREGKRIWPETEKQVRDFMRANRSKARQSEAVR
jgi:hypothetical protein